jgi:hypothetical protein
MNAFGVVKVDVFLHCPREFSGCLITVTADRFDFQTSEKPFHDSIVPAVAASAHAGFDTEFGKPILVSMAGILATW